MRRLGLLLVAIAGPVGVACTSVKTFDDEEASCGDSGRCKVADAAAARAVDAAREGAEAGDVASVRDSAAPAEAGADAGRGDASAAGGMDAGDAATGGSSGEGGLDAAVATNDAASGDAGGDAGPALPECDDAHPCAGAFNCEGQACVAPTVSCNAHKNSYPAAPDGVYWISPSGTPMRAYCDMTARSELCAELEGDHRSVTRDPSKLLYAMRSVLQVNEGTCSIWAVRDVAQQFPLTQLHKFDTQPLDTCQALGFVGNGVLGVCVYGSDPGYSTCGFPITDAYMVYGNLCSGCLENDGNYDRYMRQGPVRQGDVISSFDGSIKTSCRIR